MYEYAAGIYETIIESTSSELIHFFIIIAVAVCPLFVIMLKDRKAQRTHELQRDEENRKHEREGKQQIIDVLKENSTVIAGLKTTLDSNGTSFVKSLERVHERLNEHSTAERAAHFEIAKINTKMTSVMENQRELSGKINKILVMASGGKLPIQTDGGD